MTSLAILLQLRSIQRRLRTLVEAEDEAVIRTQYHPDLSPLGWHLGHCAFVETFWLFEKIRGSRRHTNRWRDLYVPPNTPKPERGKRLPKKEKLLHWVETRQDEAVLFLNEPRRKERDHPLMQEEYLANFLVQHHVMHYETMFMILLQRQLQRDEGRFQPASVLRAKPLNPQLITIPSGEYEIGGQHPISFDNELPRGPKAVEGCRIARRPVSNAEYLGFIEAGGYLKREHWSEAGWQWRDQNGVESPDHWRRNEHGLWYAISPEGATTLDPDQPLYGVSHYEAEAFANWAGARLPHEYAWEAAVSCNALQLTGRAWEWCGNTFHPYPDFTPFPYDEYSKPWFNNDHYTLRGASPYTRPMLRRLSFRNFYQPDKRHIFAGLRLAFD